MWYKYTQNPGAKRYNENLGVFLDLFGCSERRVLGKHIEENIPDMRSILGFVSENELRMKMGLEKETRYSLKYYLPLRHLTAEVKYQAGRRRHTWGLKPDP